MNATLRGWHRLTLDKAVEVDNRSVQPESGTRYTYVGLENIESETGRFVDVGEVDGGQIDSTKFFFEPTHLLYGKLRPYLNKTALPSFAGICSTDILPLLPKPGVLREYVAFWLRTPAFLDYAKNNATGTKMPRLGPKQLLASPILLPPLPVQRHLVQILTRADELRSKRGAALDLAESILPASFIAMFGDPKNANRGFPLEPLERLADVRSGVTKGRDLDPDEIIEVPYLRVANVQDGYLDLAEIKTIEVKPGDQERYKLENGDILMTEGGDPDKLGRGCIWRDEIEGCIHQNHVFRVRVNRQKLAPEYLAALLRTQYAKEYFLSCAKRSSNLASINSTQVKQFMVPLPPMTLQQKFVAAVETWSQTVGRLKAR